ncbi:hypothetical protein EYF80_003386 [Liparis tanakae]|uniref:Uncharacterized protein n=1 Tax=Liparis tanakae TaxID=230148 RepID=A0A4Z2J8R8_9TELE|nr:hypothetical protein EYF80_003386 [Liparis tanakae]
MITLSAGVSRGLTWSWCGVPQDEQEDSMLDWLLRICVPEESPHTALSTSLSVLSSFTVSASGVLSSYRTTAEYSPERRRPRTSSSPARIWSRLSTEPLALRRTMVLQRALTAPRMCPALKARKERQSSSRHLALSSLRKRFTTGQSISPRSSIARRFGLFHRGLSPLSGEIEDGRGDSDRQNRDEEEMKDDKGKGGGKGSAVGTSCLYFLLFTLLKADSPLGEEREDSHVIPQAAFPRTIPVLYAAEEGKEEGMGGGGGSQSAGVPLATSLNVLCIPSRVAAVTSGAMESGEGDGGRVGRARHRQPFVLEVL